MQKKFFTNLVFLVILNLVVKPFWVFGIDRTVQNVVGTEAYGFYFALFNFSLMWNMLLDMGITNYNNRNISQHQFLLHKYFSNIISLRLLMAGVYFVVSIAIGVVWGYNSLQIKFLLVLLFNQFLLSFIAYLRSNLAGLHLFKTDSLISVLDRFIMIVVCALFLWGNIIDVEFTIWWFVWIQTFAYLITALVAFILVLQKSGRLTLRCNMKFNVVLLKKSLPYALLTLLMAIYTRSDAVMMERIIPDGVYQAGIYAQAFRILDAAGMLALLFATLLLPMFARMIKKGENVNQLVEFATRLIIVPGVLLVMASVLFKSEVMDLLYHHSTTESANVFAWLMAAFIGIALTYIFGTLLTANGSLKQLNSIALLGMLVSVGLNLILIPKYQALGAAFVAMVTQSLTAAIQVFVAHKTFKMQVNYNLLILILIFALGAGIFGLISKALPMAWGGQLTVMVLSSLVLAWGIGLIRIKHVYRILKSEN